MPQLILVEERNQDDMSRKAGCYLYADTQLWLEGDVVHREDGPAVIFPDGAVRWYIQGKELTREIKTFFIENHWAFDKGLDTPEKRALFADAFLK